MAAPSKTPTLSGHLGETATALNRAIFMRESQQAARAYEELVEARDDFLLAPRLQHDLARLLELGNEPKLALRAYEDALKHHQDSEHFSHCLRAAGHLAYRLKLYKKCRAYLERFLSEGDPNNAEKMDAESILKRLPDGKGLRPIAPKPEPREELPRTRDEGTPSSFHSKSTQPGFQPDDLEEIEETIDIGSGIFEETGHTAAPPEAQDEEPPPPAEPARQSAVDDAFFGGPAAEATPAEARDAKPSREVSELGATPPVSLDSRDVRRPGSGFAARDDGMYYALIVPFGVPMNVKHVVAALKLLDGLSDEEALESLRSCKGLIRDGMTRSQAAAVHRTISSVPHKLHFMAMEPAHVPSKPTHVHRAEVLDPGLRLHVDDGVRKVRWKHVRLVACGRVEGEPTVDLYCGVGLDRYRLAHPQCDLGAAVGAAGLEENQAATRLLEQLVKQATESIFPRPLMDVVEGKSQRPKKFATPEEYERYNRCLVFAHFGAEIETGRFEG